MNALSLQEDFATALLLGGGGGIYDCVHLQSGCIINVFNCCRAFPSATTCCDSTKPEEYFAQLSVLLDSTHQQAATWPSRQLLCWSQDLRDLPVELNIFDLYVWLKHVAVSQICSLFEHSFDHGLCWKFTTEMQHSVIMSRVGDFLPVCSEWQTI